MDQQAAIVLSVNPVIPVRDVEASIEFYQRLGFQLAFRDPSSNGRYVGIKRDSVEIHLQWHDSVDFDIAVDKVNLRFPVSDVDRLYAEVSPRLTDHPHHKPSEKPWGTREFALGDLDGNGLIFYKDL